MRKILLAGAAASALLVAGGGMALATDEVSEVPQIAEPKVEICHFPPGNPENYETLEVAVTALPGHFANHPGDHLGACLEDEPLPPPPVEPGVPGPVGPAGVNGTNGTTTTIFVTRPEKCGPSLRHVSKFPLPARLAGFKRLSVKVDTLAPVSVKVQGKGGGRKYVNVPMIGRACGAHTVIVSKKGVQSAAAIWTVGGHLKLTVLNLKVANR